MTVTVSEDTDNPLPSNVSIDTAADSVVYTIRDDDPTLVSLSRVGTGAVSEGEAIEFMVSLGRALIAGEVIDVPLSISGTGVTTADWSLATKSGATLNRGVTLRDGGTATPKVRFSGAGAQTATLQLTPADDSDAAETYTVALGPDTGANGFDTSSFGTNVGGGARRGASTDFDVVVNPVLNAPTGVSATAGPGSGQVTLSWSDPGNSNISKYQYHLRIGDTGNNWRGWTNIPGSNADTVSHTVTGLTNGQIYTFVVRAFVGSAAGPESSYVFATPLLAPPTVSIARQGGDAVIEGADVVFRVTASRAVSANLTVNLVVADASNADFVSSGNEGSQSVTIASGAATADFILSTQDDTTDEVDGAVGVVVTSGTGYTVGSPSSAQVTVNDDDPTRVTLSVPDATATEGSSSDRATVRLALNRALRSGESLAISLGFSGGVLGTDFSLSLAGTPTGVALSGGTVTFSGIGVVSATTADVLLSASEDVDAADETVTVSIPSSSTTGTPRLTATLLGGGATGSRTGNGEIVLSDDDTAALVFSAPSLTVGEGSSGTYTVKLATQPTGNVTVTVGGASGEVTVDTNSGSPGNQTTLNFTTSTWNTAQTVTVSAGEDVDTTNDSATLSHTASGGGYGSVTGNVAVPNTPPLNARGIATLSSVRNGRGRLNRTVARSVLLPSAAVASGTLSVTSVASSSPTVTKSRFWGVLAGV